MSQVRHYTEQMEAKIQEELYKPKRRRLTKNKRRELAEREERRKHLETIFDTGESVSEIL